MTWECGWPRRRTMRRTLRNWREMRVGRVCARGRLLAGERFEWSIRAGHVSVFIVFATVWTVCATLPVLRAKEGNTTGFCCEKSC